MLLCLLLQVRRPKGDTLEEMGKPLFFHDVEEKFGAKWNFYHRVDAHNSLKELATDPELPGKPAVIRLASQVVDVDCETGILTLKDGTTFQKDLIVVADGQHVRASSRADTWRLHVLADHGRIDLTAVLPEKMCR
jgi:2-polyprenyl-6-methoxyphenol hydroxylase-like FAD-dependent oxidoreductase